ncbi:MAG TPA: TIGR04283 family arsenosugar biosynthesis glycosyltransferase [Pseudolabrys sp.]|nr:TIGR04283 family arsenosugar biosynthesis glycosyltransferase [Pseudolabrys sp.]
MSTSPQLSIIMPVLNEAATIEAALAALQPHRARGTEIIVVDGGSSDGTRARAQAGADIVVTASRGRAAQMNAGAAHARREILLFLHADTQLPQNADGLIAKGLASSGRQWGRFDVRITGGPLLALIGMLMNIRSRMTGIATGDQAIFVTRDAFHAALGFPQIALMEDIAFSARLKRLGRPLCLTERVTTSGRRWHKHGVLPTVFLMWRLRLAYFLGTEPAVLARRYGYAPPEG